MNLRIMSKIVKAKSIKHLMKDNRFELIKIALGKTGATYAFVQNREFKSIEFIHKDGTNKIKCGIFHDKQGNIVKVGASLL